MKKYTSIALVALSGALQFNAAAAPKELPLRWTPGITIFKGNTKQAVASEYGNDVTTLTFTNGGTFDFYSAPLATPCVLTSHDKCGGRILLQNVSSSHANDFTATGEMQFFDYDPTTGGQSLIVDSGVSNSKNVDAGKTANLPLPKVALGAGRNIPAGHLLHVVVTVSVISGNCAGFGQLLYNGPRANSSAAFLSEDTNLSMNLTTPISPTEPTNTIQLQGDGTAKITCAGVPNQAYVVQATTSLVSPSWVTIGTNTTGPDGLCVFMDTDASHFPMRFYRTASR